MEGFKKKSQNHQPQGKTSEKETVSDSPPKEKKEYLVRGEVRTMREDIAHLREMEARGEREKIAKLKPTPVPTQKPSPLPPLVTAISQPEKIQEKPSLQPVFEPPPQTKNIPL